MSLIHKVQRICNTFLLFVGGNSFIKINVKIIVMLQGFNEEKKVIDKSLKSLELQSGDIVPRFLGVVQSKLKSSWNGNEYFFIVLSKAWLWNWQPGCTSGFYIHVNRALPMQRGFRAWFLFRLWFYSSTTFVVANFSAFLLFLAIFRVFSVGVNKADFSISLKMLPLLHWVSNLLCFWGCSGSHI